MAFSEQGYEISTDNRACFSTCERAERLIGRCVGTVTLSVSEGVCFWRRM